MIVYNGSITVELPSSRGWSSIPLPVKMHNYRENCSHLSFVERCPPKAILLNSTSSYEAMNRLIDHLKLACHALFIVPILVYVALYGHGKTQSMHRRSTFRMGILMLSLFAGSSICHQLVSSFACRPIEILFDWRYMSMIGMQIFAFLVCLQHAYVFASVYLIPRVRLKAPVVVGEKPALAKSGHLALLLHSNNDVDVSK